MDCGVDRLSDLPACHSPFDNVQHNNVLYTYRIQYQIVTV